VASFVDVALFRGTVDGETVWLLVWVNDILVATQGEERVAKVKAHLTAKFDVRQGSIDPGIPYGMQKCRISPDWCAAPGTGCPDK